MAFAGFSGLITVFLSQRQARWREVEVLRFWQVLAYSLTALFFCLLPVLLAWAGIRGASLWSASSAGLALGILLIGTSFVRWANRLPDPERAEFSRPLVVLTGAGLLGSLAIASFNAIPIGLHGERAPYLVALLWLLFMAGLNFLRLLQSVVPDSHS